MIGDLIGEWIKGILIDGIMGNLSGLFNTVNTKVGEIASEVDVYPPQKAPAAPAVSSRSLFACTWRRLSPEASPIKR